MLAIAAPSFNEPSETFIRDHLRHLAPGRTVLLCNNDGVDADRLGCPVLPEINGLHKPRNALERVSNSIHARTRRYVGPNPRSSAQKRIVEFLNQHKAQALLAEYGPTGCLLMHACSEAGVPLYVHFHGHDASRLLRDRHQVRHYRALFERASGVIAPSRFLGDKLAQIGCPLQKLHIVPCGIDPARFRRTRREPLHVLAVGRLVEKKMPHGTIQAFAKVIEKMPEARLDMIGDGPLKDQCRILVDQLGLSTRVHLHGSQSPATVAQMMSMTSLLAQHSITAGNGDTEGLPVAILEAMVSALPVVSTRHSGIPEAVLHGETGLLVEEQDIDGMADAMVEIFRSPARAAAMGEAGRTRVLENFTQTHTHDRLRSIMRISALTDAA